MKSHESTTIAQLLDNIDGLSSERLEDFKKQLSHFRHDLLGPLSAAHLQAQLCLRKSPPEEFKLHVERIMQNLKDLEALIRTGTKETPAPQALVSVAKDASAGPAKVALIDDSSDMRDLFKIILTQSGYEFEGAGSGREGLELLTKNPAPDLVLLDFSLGDINGSELLDQLEKVQPDIFDKTVIVIMTGYGSLIEEPRAAAVVNKSMNIDDITDLVKKYVP